MKEPIERHERRIENSRIHLQREREAHESKGIRLDKMERDLNFSIAQLELAKKKGKDGYDDERFGFKALLG